MKEICSFVRRGRLGELEFEIASVLKASFVRESRGEEGVEFCDAPGVTNIIVSEAVLGEGDAGLGLNSGLRNPAHAIDLEGGMVLGIDLPVELGKENGLFALAGNGTDFAEETGETSIIGSDAGGVVGKAQVRHEGAGALRGGGGGRRRWGGGGLRGAVTGL